MSGASREIAYIRVERGGEESLLVAPVGAVLRDVLLANGISPYTRITQRLNCGGRGLCATCGVRFLGNESDVSDDAESDRADRNGDHGALRAPTPERWDDLLAARFGYPRLSCQIDVEGDMHVEIPEKTVRGSRRPGDRG